VSPVTQAAWPRARAAAARWGQSRAAYYPALVGTLVGGRQSGQISIGDSAAGGSSVETPPAWVADFSGSLTVRLLDFGGRAGLAEAARQTLLSANWMHDQSLQDLFHDVATAYYEHLGALAQFAASEANLKDAVKSLAAAEKRRASGVATIADVLQARAVEARQLLAVQEARGAVATTRGDLATRVGWDADTQFRVAGEKWEIPPELAAASVEDLIEIARRQRPSLAATRAEVLARQADMDVAFSAALPTMGARALADRYAILHATPSNSTSYSMGLGISLPIFEGFANLNAIRAAEATFEAQKADLQVAEQGLVNEVFTAYWDFLTATRSLEASLLLLTASEQNHRVSLGRYRTGAGDILELLNAQSLLADSRAQLVGARTNLFITYASMLNAIGEDLPIVPTEIRSELDPLLKKTKKEPHDA
ncbi:MAG: TolC family protein, partial [bacterium]